MLLSPLVSHSALLFRRHLSSSSRRIRVWVASKWCNVASKSTCWSSRAFCLCKKFISCSILFSLDESKDFFLLCQMIDFSFRLLSFLTKLPCASPGNVRVESDQTDRTIWSKAGSNNQVRLNLKVYFVSGFPYPICRQMGTWSERKGGSIQAQVMQLGVVISSFTKKQSSRFSNKGFSHIISISSTYRLLFKQRILTYLLLRLFFKQRRPKHIEDLVIYKSQRWVFSMEPSKGPHNLVVEWKLVSFVCPQCHV